MRIEERDIKDYVERLHLGVRTSGTGVRWQLLRDVPGDTARPDQLVRVAYRMELIDGTVAYESARGAPESFRVEHDEVESGLHEGIQHLSPGDSAIIIIPSHRASGDR
jgi:FKBP-type peptidyl-prolyl cis-trans isomerase